MRAFNSVALQPQIDKAFNFFSTRPALHQLFGSSLRKRLVLSPRQLFSCLFFWHCSLFKQCVAYIGMGERRFLVGHVDVADDTVPVIALSGSQHLPPQQKEGPG